MQARVKAAAILALALAGGAATPPPMLFSKAYAGDVESGSRLMLDGRIDLSVLNAPALVDVSDRLGSEKCVALILGKSDRVRMKGRSGARVAVSGKALFLADLASMFPRRYGEIDGRPWTGSACSGELAIFVDRIVLLRP